jgi:hypothetical protein
METPNKPLARVRSAASKNNSAGRQIGIRNLSQNKDTADSSVASKAIMGKDMARRRCIPEPTNFKIRKS